MIALCPTVPHGVYIAGAVLGGVGAVYAGAKTLQCLFQRCVWQQVIPEDPRQLHEIDRNDLPQYPLGVEAMIF